jgi:hypothetical protein
MPILKVLLNEKGEVVGTVRTDTSGSGTDPPKYATLVARPGQRLIEINVDDKTASIDSNTLHKLIREKHIK